MAMRWPVARLARWQWHILDALAVASIALVTYLSVAVWQSGLGDVTVYYHDALAFWHDKPRFTQFPTEYPLLALVPFSFTLLPIGSFIAAFGVGMGLLNVALYAACLRWSTRARALACLGYLLLGEQAFMTMRYDVFPALLTVGALWAAQRGSYPWAYVLLGLGTLAKVYPALFIPVVLLAQWRACDGAAPPAAKLGRMVATAALAPLVIVVGFVVVAWRNPAAALSPLTYATHRPVQVESLFATVAWVGSWFGVSVTQVYSYGSVNWVGSLANALMGWSTPLLIGGCLLVYLWRWRGGLSLPRAFVAVLGMTLLANRVFSTQYLIWAAPLVAEAEGWHAGWLVVFALNGLELGLYPYSTPGYTAADERYFLLAVAARNLTLLAVIAGLLWRTRVAQPSLLAASSAATSSGVSRTATAPSSSRA